jgi:hypothetical protein
MVQQMRIADSSQQRCCSRYVLCCSRCSQLSHVVHVCIAHVCVRVYPQLFVRASPTASLSPSVVSAGERFVRPVSSESSSYTVPTTPSGSPLYEPTPKLQIQQQVSCKDLLVELLQHRSVLHRVFLICSLCRVQVAGEVPYTFDQVMEGGGLFGALAITTEIGVINGLSTDVALGMASCCPYVRSRGLDAVLSW